MKWLLENDVTELLLTWSYEEDSFGRKVEQELVPGG